MSSKQKQKRYQDKREKLAHERQEEALDEALKNTFPASDPVSIEQPVPPDANGNPDSERPKALP